MLVIFLLILVSLSLALFFLIAMIWAVKNRQFEDTFSPSVRMLFDDEMKEDNLENNNFNKI